MYESIYSRIHHHCIMNPCMTQFGIHCDSIMNPLWPHYASRKTVHYESIVNIWFQHELCLNPLRIQYESIVWFPHESTMNPFWIQKYSIMNPLWTIWIHFWTLCESIMNPFMTPVWIHHGFIVGSSGLNLGSYSRRTNSSRENSRWTNSSGYEFIQLDLLSSRWTN